MQNIIKRTILVTLFIATSGLVVNVCAQKSKDDIRQMLKERNQEIKELVGPEGTDYTQTQREKLKDIINAVINYKAMAKFALQDTWQNISPQKREEFVAVFSKIVRNHSLTNLDIYRAKVTYKSIEVEGDDATVVTLATMDRVRTPVTYKLHYQNKLAKWVVTDLIIDNVSTARSYKRQFQDIIREKGYAYLVDTLKERVSKG